MAGRQRWARVGFGQITAPPGAPPDQVTDLLRETLVAGTAVTRYKRTWRIGQNHEVGNCIVGRIGSESEFGTVPLWDETRQDFVNHTIPEGATSPFAINLTDFRMAYQLRAGVFRRQGIMGAFQALLNASNGTPRGWRVAADLQPITLDAWLEMVDSVDQVWVRVDRPNPHYGARKNIEEMVEGSNAQSVTMTYKAQEDESISLDETILKEAREHVDQKYGDLRLDGRDGDVSERFDLKRGAAPPERKVAGDPETGEADPSDMRRFIGDNGSNDATETDEGDGG